MKKMLFIYNPNAGKGLLKAKLSDVLDIMVKAGACSLSDAELPRCIPKSSSYGKGI